MFDYGFKYCYYIPIHGFQVWTSLSSKDESNYNWNLKSLLFAATYKCFTIIIYGRNDSGLYYKTSLHRTLRS